MIDAIKSTGFFFSEINMGHFLSDKWTYTFVGKKKSSISDCVLSRESGLVGTLHTMAHLMI